MWFRRKRKSDPDSALTETLRSLQTLLEDDPGTIDRATPSPRPPAEARETSPQPTAAQATGLEPGPAVDATDPELSVGGEPELDPFALLDLPMPDAGEMELDPFAQPRGPEVPVDSPPGPGTRNEVEDRDPEPVSLPSLHNNEQWAPVAEAAEPPMTEETIEDIDLESVDTEPRAGDNPPFSDAIPLLTNVVYEPGPDEPPAAFTTAQVDHASDIVDQIVLHLVRRLQEEGLPEMDAEQERTLRALLVSIVDR